MNGDLLRRLSAISPEERRILDGGTLDMELYREGSSRNVVQACRVLAGKRIAIRTHTRFTDFPSHRHDYVEIMYVCRGSITHVVGRTPIRVEAGELLFLGCNTWHRILKVGREDIGVNFLVRPEFFRTAFDLMDSQNALSDFILDSLTGAGSADQYLHFRVSDRLPVQNLVENLVSSRSARLYCQPHHQGPAGRHLPAAADAAAAPGGGPAASDHEPARPSDCPNSGL